LAGIVILTRHGDRQGFYQSPTTYSASQTNLTVLGYLQEYQNGQDLRSTYLTGTQKPISGIAVDTAQDAQMSVEADGAGEGEVIIDSANALLQGLYPPFNDTITLANSTAVSWDRAQLIRVNTIEEDEISLEGWTDCNTWTTRLNDWYNSSEFVAQSKIANPFFASLKNVLGNRPATLTNAWNLFDFLNVNYIHNATIMNEITPDQLAQARYWANYHESGSFADSNPSNIGNVAGQTMLPGLMSDIQQIANASNPLKIAYTAISYKPFLSLFSIWQSGEALSSNIVEYASALVIEVHTDNTLNFVFRNGTQGDFEPFSVLGSSQNLPISTFMTEMEKYQLLTLASWCDACSTTEERGCSTLAALNGTGGAGYASIDSTMGYHRVSPVVAGVIGAMVTLAVVVI
ncbi:phosphoglycerate mutase-like protein, partial [Meira miltonrushii]